ncbi:SRPBCC family protein [Maribacter dokdonensis]|uniref:SRPBCC family protein n=1 Tax=Maribacter dokdonensis TaxID=320912 RepID=UPI002AAFD98E|nr:SRPBCC domain-containing protein [Maribacter dokdonensis]
MRNNEPIIVTQLFNTSMEQVWKALTHVEYMRKWYFPVIPDFKPEVGFTTSFLITNEGRNFTHNWEVIAVTPSSKISYRWTFDEYPGESISTFELSKNEQGTLLTLTGEVITGFPTNIPEFNRESGKAGWEYLIQESLVQFLKSHKF